MQKKWLSWTWCFAIDLAFLQLLSSHYYRQRPFPCSVSSLGLTALFKALGTSAYAKMSMATRNLTWATGKRKASASPHTQHQIHTTFKSVYRIYPDNTIDHQTIISPKTKSKLNYGSYNLPSIFQSNYQLTLTLLNY